MGSVRAPNLWYMRPVNETHSADPKLAPMVREIGWSHNILVMERCGDTPCERRLCYNAAGMAAGSEEESV